MNHIFTLKLTDHCYFFDGL